MDLLFCNFKIFWPGCVNAISIRPHRCCQGNNKISFQIASDLTMGKLKKNNVYVFFIKPQ